MKGTALLALGLLLAVFPSSLSRAADEVVFEEEIEYANPDNQHLQLDLARPKSDSLIDDENSSECAAQVSPPGDEDGSPLRRGSWSV